MALRFPHYQFVLIFDIYVEQVISTFKYKTSKLMLSGINIKYVDSLIR